MLHIILLILKILGLLILGIFGLIIIAVAIVLLAPAGYMLEVERYAGKYAGKAEVSLAAASVIRRVILRRWQVYLANEGRVEKVRKRHGERR